MASQLRTGARPTSPLQGGDILTSSIHTPLVPAERHPPPHPVLRRTLVQPAAGRTGPLVGKHRSVAAHGPQTEVGWSQGALPSEVGMPPVEPLSGAHCVDTQARLGPVAGHAWVAGARPVRRLGLHSGKSEKGVGLDVTGSRGAAEPCRGDADGSKGASWPEGWAAGQGGARRPWEPVGEAGGQGRSSLTGVGGARQRSGRDLGGERALAEAQEGKGTDPHLVTAARGQMARLPPPGTAC